ncbi:MAG: hypothetical protein AAGB23_07630 [Pseudomonadota bacterium]
MLLVDYFKGQRFELRSPLSPEDFKATIEPHAGSIFWPFKEGIVGGVYWGRLRLSYHGSPLFDYNAKPTLSGPITGSGKGSYGYLSYRAPTWAIAFFGFWYLMMVLMVSVLAVIVMTDNGGGELAAIPFFTLILVILAIVPIGMHRLGTRDSENELKAIFDFLTKQTDASITPATKV